jgi:hypothetical protein
VTVGAVGRVDDDLRPRAVSSIESWTGRRPGDETIRAEIGGSRWAHFPSLPGRGEDLIDALRWAAGGSFAVEVRAPEHVAAEFVRGDGGAIGIHLVNYAEGPVEAVTVSVPAARRARWTTAGAPDGVDLLPRAESRPDGRSATVFAPPALEVHGFLVVDPNPGPSAPAR